MQSFVFGPRAGTFDLSNKASGSPQMIGNVLLGQPLSGPNLSDLVYYIPVNNVLLDLARHSERNEKKILLSPIHVLVF